MLHAVTPALTEELQRSMTQYLQLRTIFIASQSSAMEDE